MPSNWKLIVGRESRNTTNLLGATYHNWVRIYAVENTDTGEMSEWVDSYMKKSAHEIAFAGRQVGITLSADAVKRAERRAYDKWNEDHPVKQCKDCYTGNARVTPRGKHRPGSHRPFPPWAHAGGGTTNKRDADDGVDAIIYPDGTYEVVSER